MSREYAPVNSCPLDELSNGVVVQFASTETVFRHTFCNEDLRKDVSLFLSPYVPNVFSSHLHGVAASTESIFEHAKRYTQPMFGECLRTAARVV